MHTMIISSNPFLVSLEFDDGEGVERVLSQPDILASVERFYPGLHVEGLLVEGLARVN